MHPFGQRKRYETKIYSAHKILFTMRPIRTKFRRRKKGKERKGKKEKKKEKQATKSKILNQMKGKEK